MSQLFLKLLFLKKFQYRDIIYLENSKNFYQYVIEIINVR